MSSYSKNHLARVLTKLLAMITVLFTFSSLAAAQDQPYAPKWELYGGYSVLYPGSTVTGQLPLGVAPLSSRLETDPRGAGATATYDFNNWFGLSLDYSNHWGSGETTLQQTIDDAGFTNLSFGPKFTYRAKHFSPFFEALIGDHRLRPEAFHHINKLGVMLGGGVDLNLSRRVAWRVFRVDYVYSNYQFAPAPAASTTIRGFRFQTGLNFMFGGDKVAPVSPSAVCAVQPSEVYAGEPVTATAAGANFHSNRTVNYSWNGTGVSVSGSEASTQIDTAGLKPGTYGITAKLSDGSRDGNASCSAVIIVREPRPAAVREPRPPTISCSPDPASVQMGRSSTITSVASSPDGRRLTYSYTSDSGTISGNSTSTTLNTSGSQPGRIKVTCNVSDDHTRPLSASATTFVNVEAVPEVVQLETRLALHSIYFQTDRPFEAKPEGGLIESQEEILKTLAEDYLNYLKYKPDAHLVLVGHADVRGSTQHNMDLTQRRVDRTKSVLVEHGVPADHLEVVSSGKEDELTADQVKDQIAQNPDLSPDDRQQMLNNLPVMVLANNRRVDVSLNTTGQQSTRRYPFNAKDYLALIKTQSVNRPPAKK